jgi:hypothetical protein
MNTKRGHNQMRYKFRAECRHDYDCLLQILPTEPNNEVIEPSDGFPDIEVEFDLNITIDKLRDLMREVEDGHVMVQTVMPIDEYTGDRNYDL